jgi:hypothetical protein
MATTPKLTGLSQVNEEFQNIIGGHGERWRHTEGQPESTLLRLAVLRDIVRSLHAQKSRCLASGRRDLSQALRGWEQRLHELRNQAKLEGELTELVTGSTPIKKRTRLLPEALYAAIDREKLERYDRQWEAVLAAEAASLGWRFWALEAWVEITLVEDWNRALNEQLWPSGLVLFVESSGVQAPAPATDQEFPLWRGRWLLVVHPRFKSPEEIALNLSQWPGTPPEAPQPPHWKLLFSPKTR